MSDLEDKTDAELDRIFHNEVMCRICVTYDTAIIPAYTTGVHYRDRVTDWIEQRGWGWQIHMHQANPDEGEPKLYVCIIFDDAQFVSAQAWAKTQGRAVILAAISAVRSSRE